MNLDIQFKGLYYFGHEKSSIHFAVSPQGFIVFDDKKGNKVDMYPV